MGMYPLSEDPLHTVIWLDNVHCFGESAQKAIDMAEKLKDKLLLWGCESKTSSQEVIWPFCKDQEDAAVQAGWKSVDKLESLGCLVDASIQSQHEIEWAMAKAWRAACANRRWWRSDVLSLGDKIQTLQTYIEPVWKFRAPVWNLNKTTLKQLDRWQMRFLRMISGQRKMPEENPEDFIRRRGRQLRQECLKRKWQWSKLFLELSLKTKAQFVRRARTPGHQHILCHSATWFERRRAEFANLKNQWSVKAGKTDTRVRPGRPSRWHTLTDSEIKHITGSEDGWRQVAADQWRWFTFMGKLSPFD